MSIIQQIKIILNLIFLIFHQFAGKLCKMGALAWEVWTTLSMGKILRNWRESKRTCCNNSFFKRMPSIPKTGININKKKFIYV